MRILIMGLPGSGKTYLAERLQPLLPECAWFNADMVRTMCNDWDFSPEGRMRQALRMKRYSEFEARNGRWSICDFVAPTRTIRRIFAADYVVWLNTIDQSRYDDTNKMFEPPIINNSVNYCITGWYEDTHKQLAEVIQNHAKGR